MANGTSGFRLILRFLRPVYQTQTPRKLQQRYKNVYEIASADSEIAQHQTKFHKRWLSRFLKRTNFIRFTFTDRVRQLSCLEDMDPPDCVKGMTVLNRDLFKKTVKVPGLKIPVKKVGLVTKKLKAGMLKMAKIKAIANLAEDDPDKTTHKLFLFSPERYTSYQDLDESDRQTLGDNGINCSEFEMFTVDLTYDNWNVPDIVRAILPEEAENVSGFSTIGHIAHLNLREEAIPYKHLIGEVIIDKVPGIRTVVNKLDMIDNTFRNFKMELLAGEDNFITQTRENGVVYEFDFSKVYWNPRLVTEHARITSQFSKGDIVYDMFAGVGPFAIPAGKRGIIVHANDLNPHSYSSLQKNITLNKLKTGTVAAYNLDAREFARTVVKSHLIERLKPDTICRGGMHILMNLPASAIEFLDCFVSLLTDAGLSEVDEKKLPIVHCYSFSKSEDPCKDVQEQGEVILGQPITTDVDVRFVRSVSPNKEMMCLSFRLTKDILFVTPEDDSQTSDQIAEDEPDAKRQKTN